jgi:glycosyltransferase involved in cell wall biosynthesis
MKILHTVEFYYPSIGGMQEVVRQLSERLVAKGHEVTIATTKLSEREGDMLKGVHIKEFAISGNAVRGLKGDVGAYERFLLEEEFDVVVNFAAQQWATDIALPLLKDIKAKKVFVPTGFSMLYNDLYKDYFENMKGWLKEYDMNVFLSNDYRDMHFAKKNGVQKTMIIPNGAGEDEFLKEYGIDIRERFGIPKDHFLVLHVGSHTGVKGHREAIEIFKRAKIKNATFLLIANEQFGGCKRNCKTKAWMYSILSGRKEGKRIIVTSLSRKETVVAYQQADVFLFPSNIECSPIVLFESMAGKTAFLTTDVGNSKEIVEWSGGGEVLPTTIDKNGYSHADISGSAEMLEELYYDKEKREMFASKGFDAWKEKFSWERITDRYEELYASLCNNDEE